MVNSGTETVLCADKGVDRDRVAAFVRHIKQAEIVDIGTVIPLGLNVDLPLEAEPVEIVDEIAAQEGLQGLIRVREVHSLDHRLGFVHVGVNLGNVPKRGGKDVGQLGTLLRGRHEFLGILGDKLHVRAAAVFQNERHATRGADARNGGRRKREGGRRLRQRRELTIDMSLDRIDLEFRRLALRPFLQRNEEEAGIGALNGA